MKQLDISIIREIILRVWYLYYWADNPMKQFEISIIGEIDNAGNIIWLL